MRAKLLGTADHVKPRARRLDDGLLLMRARGLAAWSAEVVRSTGVWTAARLMNPPRRYTWLVFAWALAAVGCGGVEPARRDTQNRDASAPAPAGLGTELLDGHLWFPRTVGEAHDRTDARVGGAVVESRVILEPAGSEALSAFPQFSLTAFEYHAVTSGDPLRDAREVLGDDWDLQLGPFVAGIQVVWILADRRPWNGEVPIHVLGAVLIHVDRTVQRLSFYIPPSKAEDRPSYASRARQIVEALRPGPRHLRDTPGPARLGDVFVVDVPQRYCLTCQDGPPGQLACATRWLRRLGTGERPRITSFFVLPANLPNLPPPSNAQERAGVLLGHEVVWYHSVGDVRSMEARVELGAERQLRILVVSSDEQAERAQLDMLRSLRLASSPGR
jgi:hypothetical protein